MPSLIAPLLAGLALAGFTGLLLAAAWGDAARYLIPNRLSLAILGVYPFFVAAAHFSAGSYPNVNWLGGLIVGMAVLAAGILLFARGWVGGGDVKLLASASVWAGPALVFDLLVTMALSGGVLAVLVMLRGRNDAGRALPYGIAIAAGGVYVALRLAGATVARPLLG